MNTTYTFIPFVALDNSSAASPGRTHALAQTTIEFESGQRASYSVKIMGSGEVAAIRDSNYRRMYPRPGAMDAESNYFPTLEFTTAFFPWQFPHVPVEPQERFRPWLVLITLADGEYTQASRSSLPATANPAIEVDRSFLPDLAQSWAWAHVQVDDLQPGEDIHTLVEERSKRIFSRLLCPRYLKPGIAYQAFLVPAFERARRSLLGNNDLETIAANVPAWNAGSSGSVVLPYYHSWRFGTTSAGSGDFEFLVKKLLPPVVLPETVGFKEIDVRNLGFDLPARH